MAPGKIRFIMREIICERRTNKHSAQRRTIQNIAHDVTTIIETLRPNNPGTHTYVRLQIDLLTIYGWAALHALLVALAPPHTLYLDTHTITMAHSSTVLYLVATIIETIRTECARRQKPFKSYLLCTTLFNTKLAPQTLLVAFPYYSSDDVETFMLSGKRAHNNYNCSVVRDTTNDYQIHHYHSSH